MQIFCKISKDLLTIVMDKEEILNSFYNLNYNSLSSYIIQACPFIPEGKELVFNTIENIARKQKEFSVRIVEQMEADDMLVTSFAYPITMSELNYLSIEYLHQVLLNELKAELKQNFAFIKELAENGEENSVALSLLEKGSGMLGDFIAMLECNV